MNMTNAQSLMIYHVKTPCPFSKCNKTFRTKTSMRAHLKEDHTDEEFKEFMKSKLSIKNEIKIMNDKANQLETEKENKMLEDEQKQTPMMINNKEKDKSIDEDKDKK